MVAIAAGYAPTSLQFYEEPMVSHSEMDDAIARVVVQRFRAARDSKRSNSVFQGMSTVKLLLQADKAMSKEYTDSQKEILAAAFGTCPTRYMGVTSSKVTMTADWKSELVSADPGGLLQIIPTPDPRLPEASIMAIKAKVKRELVQRLADSGVGDPTMLIDVNNGRLHPLVKKFLEAKAPELREIEKARIVTAAAAAAKKLQVKMRDVIVEGDFRDAYASMNADQFKYGIGLIRFPYWKFRTVLADKQDFKGAPNRIRKLVPTFAGVNAWNFFPTNDSRDLEDATALMEYREVTKVALVGMADDKRYKRDVIERILVDYTHNSRGWMFPDQGDTKSETGERTTYWEPEEVVAVLHHEGLFTGKDLQEQGLTGYEATKTYEARVEVCCGRTIRIEVKNPNSVEPRSYAMARFDVLGDGIWNCIGIPAILADTESRVNTLLRVWEDNADWSMRPPLMTNPDSLKHPHQAMSIAPGMRVEVNDLIGPGTIPEPIRAIRGPTAQYQIMFPIIQALIRGADAEVGIPNLNAPESIGRGSLGELSARVTQAVRRVRAAAYSEDRSLKPLWNVLYDHVASENPELLEEADLTMNYLGVVGILQQEQVNAAKMAAVSLAKAAVTDQMAGPDVLKYAYAEALEAQGFPMQALGEENPLISNAISVALAGGGTPVAGGGLAGAPALDGRSGSISAVPSAIANTNGGSTASLPPI